MKKMNRKMISIVLALFLIALMGCDSQDDSYSRCVNRCIQNARDTNVERSDITNVEYQRIIKEHKAYICPSRCE